MAVAIATPPPRVSRVASVDVIRGIVMVLMAIDHVRVYAGVPAGGATAGVFFTRWVTHFCAPVFVFCAGISAYLMVAKAARDGGGSGTGTVSRFLVTRGLLLTLLEPTVIRLSWTFSLDYSQFLLAGVIWMLGVCMMLMAALVWLPLRAIAVLGIVVVFGQDLFGALPRVPVSQFLYFGGEIPIVGGPTITVLYSIVPWIGVMALGYGFGAILTTEPAARDRLSLRIGLTAGAAFVLLAGVVAFVSGPGEEGKPFLFRLLDQRKYPASQLFLLMTLAPAIALLPYAGRTRGATARMFEVFGRVPMFYYLLHIPVIHAVSLAVWYTRDGSTHSAAFLTAPYVWMPDDRWPLWLLYAVFAASIAVLYPPCRWYAEYKSRTRSRWTRYI
jgi:uncharacterized membrane protein